MTDNSIQQARDVLAKWRDGDVLLWHCDEHGTVLDSTGAAVVIGATEGDARLIVGTAGNPELLDAIDLLLEAGVIHESRGHYSGSTPHAERIAAAVIAADERMTS
jgi:uncharacterized protein YjlB